MKRNRLTAIVLAMASVGATIASGEEPQRDADREAIRKGVAEFTAAFERGDAAQAAAHLTAGAELRRDGAEVVSGRSAIQKLFADHFASSEGQSIVLKPEALRFTSRDTALEEGEMKTSVGGKAPASQQYSLLHVREDGKWLLGAIKEWGGDEPDVRDLDWLVGEWRAEQPQAAIHTTYEWVGNRAFLRGNITVRQKNRTVSAMQVIGEDPRTGQLTIWIFEANGGVTQGTCTREGDTWVFQTEGLLANGGVAEAMNLLVRINDNTITWQPVKLRLDDEEIGDLPPMKVTRVTSAK